MPKLIQIGTVTTRSGVLIVIDTGYLGIWSHNRSPILPDGALSPPEALHRANSFVDLRITGKDAAQVGRLLDMSWHLLYIYDQPPDHSELQAKFDEVIHRHHLNARLETLSARISHRERVNLAIHQGSGAGEIQFHGVWAVVAAGAPINKPLRVLGERMPAPGDANWKRVIVECNPDLPIVRSVMVGNVGVDYSRLMVADVDALGAWHHEDSLDGLADFVFWGRDAGKVAQTARAPRLSASEFGWLNTPEALAQEHGASIEHLKEKDNLKFATDYRPHSHHWQIMRPTRESPTESGTIEVDGMTVCNFMTTWGDGVFEVYRDLSELNELVQIRIELG
jgi:hypothetical protein